MIKVKEIRRRVYEVKIDEETQQEIEFISKLWGEGVVNCISGMLVWCIQFIRGHLT